MPRARRTPEKSTMVTEEVVKQCPACHTDITATVRIEVTMGEPMINDSTSEVTVPSTSRLARYSIHHTCEGADIDGEPDPPVDPPSEPERKSRRGSDAPPPDDPKA